MATVAPLGMSATACSGEVTILFMAVLSSRKLLRRAAREHTRTRGHASWQGEPEAYALRAGHTGSLWPSGTEGRAHRGGVLDRRSTGPRWRSRPTGVSLVIDHRSSSSGVNSLGTSLSWLSGT